MHKILCIEPIKFADLESPPKALGILTSILAKVRDGQHLLGSE